MGKKQRLKQERRRNPEPGPAADAARKRTGYWLLGLLLFAALVIGAVVAALQVNKTRILQATARAAAEEMMGQIGAGAGKLTFQQSRDLRGIITDLDRLAGSKVLDARAVAHMQFLFGVIREILQQGNLETAELAKLKTQVSQLGQYLQTKSRVPAKAAPTPAPAP